MTSRAPTLSGIALLAACPGSASLPRQQRASGPAASLGTAIHELIETRIRGDHDAPAEVDAEIVAIAHGLAPDDAGRLAFLAEHMRLPIPAGALAEVPLGLFPDGSVRRIEGGAGSYPDVGQILSGQLDCMWAEPEPFAPMHGVDDGRSPIMFGGMVATGSTLWLTDWKTGDEDNVPPIARNWQLRAGALLAARWTGATRVIVAICYVNAAECAVAVRNDVAYEGRWEVGAPLDAAPLDAIEVELRAVLRAARGESDGASLGRLSTGTHDGDRVDAGRYEEGPGENRGGDVDGSGTSRVDPDARGQLILGPHCEHCPSRVHCPEFGAAARQLVEQSSLSRRSPVLMLPHERALLAAMIPAMRATLDSAEEALRAGGPVLLADGRVYAPHLEPVTEFITGPTFDVLAAAIGDDKARKAFEATAASIKRALEDAGAPRGTWKRVRAEIEAAGGVVVTARPRWGRRYPATPVEVVSGEAGPGGSGDGVEGAGSGRRDDCLGTTGRGGLGEDPGAEGRGEVGGLEPVQLHQGADPVGLVHGAPRPMTRAACPFCSRDVAVNRGGGKPTYRVHQKPGSAMRCPGGGEPVAIVSPADGAADPAQMAMEVVT